MHRVGLCMIVKDEAHVIERCLTSVRAQIDHWVIVDTGSTDGTQQLVQELLGDVPGFLLERPWRDFGHNRSEALAAARPHAEYTFVIDADEVVQVPDGFVWPRLVGDSISLLHRTGSMVYWRGSLVANRLPWRYEGVLHEYLTADATTTSDRLAGPEVIGHFDGGRSQGMSGVEKYARDARVLEEALGSDPDNARYQYYLARSYRDSAQLDLALAAYRRRAEMGGFAEEVADSLLWVARLLEPSAPPDEVIAAYLRAWEARPTRAEPLAALAVYCRLQKRFALGRAFAAHALTIPRPDDLLWIQEDVYEWRCLDEYAVSSYWTGHYADSADACGELLAGVAVPAAQRGRIADNLRFALDKLTDPSVAKLPRQVDRRGRLLDVEHAEQGEQAPRGVEIHLDLAGEAFLQQFGAVIVEAAAGHVDRLDAAGAVAAHRLEVGIADREIVADRPAEAGEPDPDRVERIALGIGHHDREPPFLDPQRDPERPFLADHVEMVLLEQVEDRDPPLLLDIGVALQDGAFIQLDIDDPGIGHGVC